MGEINSHNLVRKHEGRDHFRDLGVNGRIILEGILRKQGTKVWTECI